MRPRFGGVAARHGACPYDAGMPEVGQWGPDPLLDRNSRPVRAAACRVYQPDGTTLATLYASQAGTTTITNPMPQGVASTAAGLDTNGNLSFYAPPGPYVLAISVAGQEVYRAPITVSVDTPSGGAAQTPWVQDIDAADFALSDLHHVTFGEAGGWPADVPGIGQYNGALMGVLGPVGGQLAITDPLGFNQSGDGIYWQADGIDGEQFVTIWTGPDAANEWSFDAAGALNFPGAAALSEQTGNYHGLKLTGDDRLGFQLDGGTTFDPGVVTSILDLYAISNASNERAGYDAEIQTPAGDYAEANGQAEAGQAHHLVYFQPAGGDTASIDMVADQFGPVFRFQQGDGSAQLPWLAAVMEVPYSGLPGLLLYHPTADTAVGLSMGGGDLSGSSAPHNVIDMETTDGYAAFYTDLAAANGDASYGTVASYPTSAQVSAAWYAGGDTEQRLVELNARQGDTYLAFQAGDGTVPIPNLHATQSDPWNGDPGLTLIASGASGGADQGGDASFLVGTPNLPTFTQPYAVAAMVVEDEGSAYGDFDIYAELVGGDFANVDIAAIPSQRAHVTIEHGNGAVRDGMTLVVTTDGVPTLSFVEGDGTVPIPLLRAFQSNEWEQLPGLILAHDAGPAANAAEFQIAAGDYITANTDEAIIDFAASSDPSGFGVGFEVDMFTHGTGGVLADDVSLYIYGFVGDGHATISSQQGIRINAPLFGVNRPPVSTPNVTGSRGGNAALASLLTALALVGVITDGTSA